MKKEGQPTTEPLTKNDPATIAEKFRSLPPEVQAKINTALEEKGVSSFVYLFSKDNLKLMRKRHLLAKLDVSKRDELLNLVENLKKASLEAHDEIIQSIIKVLQ